MFKTSRDLLSAIEKIEKIYASNPETKKFFVESCRQYRDLRRRLNSNFVRIAIIGITSSGKSTLMNAILGEKLLPTRVAPTSSKQVICGYDTEKYALIKFTEDSGKKDKIVQKNIFTELSNYGDEQNNPTKQNHKNKSLNNEKNVEELQVFSPDFKFRKELIFIDTPGLDAYGLTSHEEITLKLVLPSVDMVLFLTNVKCDSDKQNLDFIDRATSEDKPLIIVQNKIDSITEKRSKNYGIEKTKEQVKQEHYKRLERLLNHAKNQSVREAPIIQVSAKCPNWEESNLESLNKILSVEVDKNLERFKTGHIRQFHNQLNEDLTKLSRLLKDHAEQEQEIAQQQQIYDGYLKNIKKAESTKDEIDKEIENKLANIYNDGNSLQQLVTNSSQKGSKKREGSGIFGSFLANIFDKQDSGKTFDTLPKSIEQKLESFKNNVRNITPYFSSSISKMQEAFKLCCADMNLNYRQIVKITPIGAFQMQAENITEVIEGGGEYHEPVYRTRRVARRSIGGKIKRFFGRVFDNDDWGYDEEEVEVRAGYHADKTVYSAEKILAYVKATSQKLAAFFDEKYTVFDKQTEHSLQELYTRHKNLSAELKMQETITLPKSLIVELQAKIKQMLPTEKTLQLSPKRNSKVKQLSATKHSETAKQSKNKDLDFLEIECKPWEAAFLTLAQNQSLETNQRFMLDYIKRSNLSNICICGWDKNHIENFLNFFFANQSRTECINFNNDSNISASKLANKLIFLLINAEQSGSTANKLYSSKINNLLYNAGKTGKIVWVMDSVSGLANWQNAKLDSLAEAYFEMIQMSEKFLKPLNITPYDFMACDSDLYYSILFHELYFSDFNTEAKRQKFIAEISELFNLNVSRQHITGRYLNDFYNLRKIAK